MIYIFKNIIDYYKNFIDSRMFILVPELSMKDDFYYKMITKCGEGYLKIYLLNNFMVINANYIPKKNFEKISEIQEDYVEISQFESDSSILKEENKDSINVGFGIFSYINNSKKVSVYCKKYEPVKFTKIILTEDYYDKFLKDKFEKDFENVKSIMRFVSLNPFLPEINFLFQQIKSCKAKGLSKKIYIESKILELLSLSTQIYEEKNNINKLSVKITPEDKKYLENVLNYMKNNLNAYPSIEDMAEISNMSKNRFQMAFKKIYGATYYKYFQMLKFNRALLLLNNSNYSIKKISSMVGYSNTGHFTGLFRKMYGVTPKKYRDIFNL
ncbi:AraC family transcriptional regulator [Oceanotoga sp. DSM 15011]|uniref:helix-turn-helix domain-containing protein n=1 Tax=Oceanotoga sp. DSM 15011 TaxID=2984951 RepID=UPI0021F43DC7|nr:AraC family transcriptional regulator [Oceanotoga sp. DSM 15011]UYO99261.1 AraC family transcriptional regulator [Oceanotoga sp. DSM 15011]